MTRTISYAFLFVMAALLTAMLAKEVSRATTSVMFRATHALETK